MLNGASLMSSDMSNVAIAADDLGKFYRLGRRKRRWLRSGDNRDRDGIWALRKVSFEARTGQALGIIGHNGAGKTTLLKILSRITEPTTGSAFIRGRVGALLEVGTGFHPELTGRENVYLSSAIFGMRRHEISRRFDEIVEFAGPEVSQFLDIPVKRYSSGMLVRLGFAVAAHLEPEILILDEVLSVGDAAFQKKSLGRMGAATSGGRTVLMVSHNLGAVQSLCDRAIWIDHGRIASEGEPREVIRMYLASSAGAASQRTWASDDAPGNSTVRLLRAGVRPEGRAYGDPASLETPIELKFTYENRVPSTRLKLVLEIYNEQNVLVIHSASFDEADGEQPETPTGQLATTCRIPGRLLNTGAHSVSLRIVRDEHKQELCHEGLLSFDVVDDGEASSYHRWLGAVRPALDWRTWKPLLDVDGP
jgi:lipopolysaccharide transport system ATP-binding protein